MGKFFGTDGVRGIANIEVTAELAFELGRATTFVLRKENRRPIAIIGKDTRVSGDMLENAIAAGILAAGGNVIKVGVIPTPAVAYLVKYYEADAGIVISASHNPFEYNGIKIFNSEGFKLADSIEAKIEDIIIKKTVINSDISGEKLGKCIEAEEDALELYSDFLESTVDISLEGMRIVIDCANGASYKVAEKVFLDLGAEVIAIGNKPNGTNINDNCGSTHPQNLQLKVVETNANIGFAFDGDADRLIVVDEKGQIIDGDKIVCICARMLFESGKLKKNKVTSTIMSNLGLRKYLEKIGIEVEVAGVGDRYVLESMKKTGCVLGGEQSGHVIFLDYSTTGDGVLSALQFLVALKMFKEEPSQLAFEIDILPQVLVNASVKNENKKLYLEDNEITAKIIETEAIMEGNGRVLVRPSGTEPLVRVMIEGKDIEQIHDLAQELADLLNKKFG